MDESLLILGASTRAAAFSALRAGLKPWCVDLFADRDLRARCPAIELAPPLYPTSLVDLARQAPPGPWMYTGGLENRPRLVRRLMRARPLWGNSNGALAKARNPLALHRALLDAGVPCPDVLPYDGRHREGRWLIKPVAGAGGRGIRFAAGDRPPRPGEYLQSFVEGPSRSATFVADGTDAILLGVTWQLVGEGWLHAPAFRYCGSIGPLCVRATERVAWTRLGRAITTFAGLRGLFGVDAIDADGGPWPVEVNPRYTASVEVLEYATHRPILAWHRNVFDPCDRARLDSSPGAQVVVGKAIYYAPGPLTFPTDGPWTTVLSNPRPVEELPPFADIPRPGQRIPAGGPVLTLFTRGDNPTACEARLREVAAELDRCLLE